MSQRRIQFQIFPLTLMVTTHIPGFQRQKLTSDWFIFPQLSQSVQQERQQQQLASTMAKSSSAQEGLPQERKGGADAAAGATTATTNFGDDSGAAADAGGERPRAATSMRETRKRRLEEAKRNRVQQRAKNVARRNELLPLKQTLAQLLKNRPGTDQFNIQPLPFFCSYIPYDRSYFIRFGTLAERIGVFFDREQFIRFLEFSTRQNNVVPEENLRKNNFNYGDFQKTANNTSIAHDNMVVTLTVMFPVSFPVNRDIEISDINGLPDTLNFFHVSGRQIAKLFAPYSSDLERIDNNYSCFLQIPGVTGSTNSRRTSATLQTTVIQCKWFSHLYDHPVYLELRDLIANYRIFAKNATVSVLEQVAKFASAIDGNMSNETKNDLVNQLQRKITTLRECISANDFSSAKTRFDNAFYKSCLEKLESSGPGGGHKADSNHQKALTNLHIYYALHHLFNLPRQAANLQALQLQPYDFQNGYLNRYLTTANAVGSKYIEPYRNVMNPELHEIIDSRGSNIFDFERFLQAFPSQKLYASEQNRNRFVPDTNVVYNAINQVGKNVTKVLALGQVEPAATGSSGAADLEDEDTKTLQNQEMSYVGVEEINLMDPSQRGMEAHIFLDLVGGALTRDVVWSISVFCAFYQERLGNTLDFLLTNTSHNPFLTYLRDKVFINLQPVIDRLIERKLTPSTFEQMLKNAYKQAQLDVQGISQIAADRAGQVSNAVSEAGQNAAMGAANFGNALPAMMTTTTTTAAPPMMVIGTNNPTSSTTTSSSQESGLDFVRRKFKPENTEQTLYDTLVRPILDANEVPEFKSIKTQINVMTLNGALDAQVKDDFWAVLKAIQQNSQLQQSIETDDVVKVKEAINKLVFTMNEIAVNANDAASRLIENSVEHQRHTTKKVIHAGLAKVLESLKDTKLPKHLNAQRNQPIKKGGVGHRLSSPSPSPSPSAVVRKIPSFSRFVSAVGRTRYRQRHQHSMKPPLAWTRRQRLAPNVW